MSSTGRLFPAVLLALLFASILHAADILTPPPPSEPRINGPRIYGQRPGRPFLYTVPATGDDPITYSADGLPSGLSLDARTGRISGTVSQEGDFKVTLTATNNSGKDTKPLLIKIGDTIALTPPLGWNSWNCFAGAVDQDKVEAQAAAMVDKGLIKHGWTYINIDDTWQGQRSGPDNALQPNDKFPDMKKLCDDIHALGLKAGIYSTPWAKSYAGYCGGSSDDPGGKFTKKTGAKQVNRNIYPWAEGKYHFMTQDAKQWADWGFDYLKYDWNPIIPSQTAEMADALKASGRDFIYSLSNSAPFSGVADWAKLSNAWRTTGDIRDTWRSMTNNGFSQDKWAQYGGPGHWNDPDMLVVGMVGWGPKLHATGLTPDEQYTHISLWCLLASPLLIGCDMTHLDDFTLSLLTNDEVLAVDQDSLGVEARRISDDPKSGAEAWSRPLADGTVAVGLFNRGRYEVVAPPRNNPDAGWKLLDRSTNDTQDFPSDAAATDALQKLAAPADISVSVSDLKLSGPQPVRDLWRQKDLDKADDKITATVPFHGVMLLKVGAPTQQQ